MLKLYIIKYYIIPLTYERHYGNLEDNCQYFMLFVCNQA
ncbi:hypothetical protein Mpsy_0055 [Methanolobus psychrophilus R15]|nr:hypothetical protein Mpsy_0055 [Methanolobus psychrophilus R15]